MLTQQLHLFYIHQYHQIRDHNKMINKQVPNFKNMKPEEVRVYLKEIGLQESSKEGNAER